MSDEKTVAATQAALGKDNEPNKPDTPPPDTPATETDEAAPVPQA